MMARTGENIYKRKDGRWEARYIAFYDGNGKAKYNYIYARSYTEVKSKLLKSQKCVLTTSAEKEKGKEKYEYWLEEWLRAKRLSVKESTYIHYRNTVENHIKPDLGKFPISKISTSLMERFVSHKLQNGRIDGNGGLSPKSMSDIITIIKESFKYAQSYDTIVICNFDRIVFKKNIQEMRVLSQLEEQRLLSVLLSDLDTYKLGVFICLYTGIRIGELCALQWKNISLKENSLKIEHTMQRLQSDDFDMSPKTRIIITEPKSFAALRTIPLPEFVANVINPFVSSPNAYVLSGECKTVIEPRTMQNKFKTYLEEGKIEDANFHSLRHTFATRCIEAGFDVKTLSEILGHSSVKITLDKYVHSSMQLKRNNMEKLRPAIV
jgi:integrase